MGRNHCRERKHKITISRDLSKKAKIKIDIWASRTMIFHNLIFHLQCHYLHCRIWQAKKNLVKSGIFLKKGNLLLAVHCSIFLGVGLHLMKGWGIRESKGLDLNVYSTTDNGRQGTSSSIINSGTSPHIWQLFDSRISSDTAMQNTEPEYSFKLDVQLSSRKWFLVPYGVFAAQSRGLPRVVHWE